MSGNFLVLVGYEYKKIFKRKSTYFSFLIIAIIIVFSVLASILGYTYKDGVKDVSKYEQMKSDREYAGKLKGYLDEEKISFVIEQNNIAYSNPENIITYDGKKELTDEAHERYIKPYKEFAGLIGIYAQNNERYGCNKINYDASKGFYDTRLNKIDEMLENSYFIDEQASKYLGINSKVKIPLYFNYAKGYSVALERINIAAIFTALAISICIAPIFSSEYSDKTAQLILASKTGKNKEIYAKLFTGISFSITISAISLGLYNFFILSIYGFDGAKASFQVTNVFSPYPINMMQALLIMMGVSIMAILLISVFTMFLSSKLKTGFGVIIISNILLFVQMFIQISDNGIVSNILRLLPIKMLETQYVLSIYPLWFGKIAFTPYVFLPIFCFIIIIVLIPFIIKAFKNHQIG